MDWTSRLKLRQLEWLISLHETGSVSRTAALVGISQPALSKWLKELEEDVGVPLFERHARGLRLTEQGQPMLYHARRIVGDVARATDEMREVMHGARGHVRLGTSPVVSPAIPRAIAVLSRSSPGIVVTVIEDSFDRLLIKLEGGTLDLVIARLDDSVALSGVRYETLFEEPVRVVAHPGHPVVGNAAIDWPLLSSFPWIVSLSGTPMRAIMRNVFARNQLPLPSVTVESMSFLVNLTLLEEMQALMLLSGGLAETFTQRGLLSMLPISVPGAARSVGVLWRDDESLSAASMAMRESLRAAQRSSAAKVAERARKTG